MTRGPMAVGLALAAGCAATPDARLDRWTPARLADTFDVARFAEGSAPRVFYEAYAPVAFLLDEDALRPTCPRWSDDGTVLRAVGDCVDAAGDRWFGEAVVERTGARFGLRTAYGDLPVARFGAQYDGFGSTRPMACPDGGAVEGARVLTGQFRMLDGGPDVVRFTAELLLDGVVADPRTCTAVPLDGALVYDGTVRLDDLDADGDARRHTWNGEGRLGDAVYGTVTVATVDEVVAPDVCGTEAVAGTTRLEARGRVVRLTYDGEVACDDPPAVPWSLDGAPEGEVRGAACAQGPSSAGFGLLVAAAAAARRRVRARPDSTAEGCGPRARG